MKKLAITLFVTLLTFATASGITVGVSWANFQEERWRIDEAAMIEMLDELGAEYLSADAQSSPEKQLDDIESLITRGAQALIVIPQDANAVLPAVARAQAEGIPVVGYDRLIEADGVFYLTFDNVEVGRLQAQAVYKAQPTGNYVFIKGSPTDPNADFLHEGQLEVLQEAIDAGNIVVVGDQYTEGWNPEVAQRNMEQILTATDNQVDAVVASNDGTAGGVVAALEAQGMGGLPVSGQDGDIAALNRVARGLQTVSVWKDARELGRASAAVAVALATGQDPQELAGDLPDITTWTGGPQGVPMDAILLDPIPITFDNLDIVIDAGWADRDDVCQGVDADNAPPACQ